MADKSERYACNLLQSYLDFSYAKEMVELVPRAIQDVCFGCQSYSSSENEHCCLIMTFDQKVQVSFDIILQQINEDLVLFRWNQLIQPLENTISPEELSSFRFKVYSDEWRSTCMKTAQWKTHILKLIVKLHHLERVF